MTRKVRKSKLRKRRNSIKTKRRSKHIRTRRINRINRIKGGMGMLTKMASKYIPADVAKDARVDDFVKDPSLSKAKNAYKEGKDMLPQDQKGKQSQPEVDEPDVPESKFQSFGKLISFSLSSLIISPLYILAVIANLPLNTINNLSGRSFEGHKTDALGTQLYKYMFEGYKKDNKNDIEEKLKNNPDDYIIDEDLKVKGNTITQCDSNKCNNPMKGGKMKGGKMKGGYVSTYKTFKEMLGVLSTKEQVIHNLKSLEDTIDNMKMNFDDRKDEIRKMFKNIRDPKLLFKAIVVCNNLIKECKEGVNEKAQLIKDNIVVKNPYEITDGKLSSHMYMNVCYLNPKCMKSCNRCDLVTNISCAMGRLGPDCAKLCNCNLFNNIVSIYHSYARILLKSFAGNSNNLYFIMDLMFMVVRFYANTEDKTINKDIYKMYLNLDKIEEIKYVGDFSKVIKEQTVAIELFKKIICKYGIYEIIKENFKEVVDEANKNAEELKKLKGTLLAICDAPDNQKENIKIGLKTIKNTLLSASIPNPLKKTEPNI